MWISKKERDKMVSDRDSAIQESREWKAKYKAITENAAVCHNNGAVVIPVNLLRQILEPAEQAKAELNILRAELDTWKQRYADEVQKRLALIEQIGGQE